MKQLEDQLKDSFDHFEPEVDPSVWAKVSSQIATPLSPANDGGSSVASTVSKGVLSKLGPVAGWISGATAVIVGGALLWNLTSKPAENEKAVQQKEVSVKAEEQSISQSTTAPEDKIGESKTISSVDVRKDQPSNDLHQKTQLNSSELVSSDNSTENNTEENISAAPAKATETSNSKSADNHDSRNAVTNSSSDNSSQNSTNNTAPASTTQKSAKPVLMLNTKGGFAPLAVTVITNQEGKTAEIDFGDGTVVSQSESATHKFEEPGIYTIRCKVAGTELESTVEVLGKIGSAFSPNGDGINDLFVISDPQVMDVEISIFDRAGKKIYASKASEISWDGKTNGDRLAETGTYFYNIFVTSQNGSTYKQKGTINLFR